MAPHILSAALYLSATAHRAWIGQDPPAPTTSLLPGSMQCHNPAAEEK